MTTHSIRIINYWGDLDDLHDLIVIGPYETAAARDADIGRLAALPDVYGSAKFLQSTVDPETAPYRATPQQVAAATDLETLTDAIYA